VAVGVQPVTTVISTESAPPPSETPLMKAVPAATAVIVATSWVDCSTVATPSSALVQDMSAFGAIWPPQWVTVAVTKVVSPACDRLICFGFSGSGPASATTQGSNRHRWAVLSIRVRGQARMTLLFLL
jgi:hypothetical protein